MRKRTSGTFAAVVISLAIGGHFSGAHAAGASSAAASMAANSTNAKAAPRTLKFSGGVSQRRFFEKQIGTNLFFRLIPEELGWALSVGDKTSPENNFASVVTPPYRGINAIHVEGWHFRNADNSGANQAGANNVNAPQEVREFYFVLDGGDYRKAFDALQAMLWPHSFSQRQIDQAQSAHGKLSKGHGKLTIRGLTLYSLEAGKQAGINSMTFDVAFDLP
jgi:hypothetical protein